MNFELPFPTCERVTGVQDNYVYEVRSGGVWEIHFRRRPGQPALAGGTASSVVAGTAKARAEAKKLALAGLKPSAEE